MTFNKEIYAKTLTHPSSAEEYIYYDIEALAEDEGVDIHQIPYTIRVLIESALRQYDGDRVTEKHIRDLLNWQTSQTVEEYPFKPQRVILQDFTGVPAIVDLASMREAMSHLGLNPDEINPDIPVDLVIDHSVQVDYFGTAEAIDQNQELEFERNDERYKFIKWAQGAFDNFKVVPNNTGIVHQVNIEYLADIVGSVKDEQGRQIAFPDTVFGTDSHTPMVNALGVLGWGVGGIEAEAAMLGQFSYNPIPEVVGVELTGKLNPTVNATDLVLSITELLRSHQVVGKFVEYYGDGIDNLTLADRATIANMAPEYGATVGFFPIDDETLKYMALTNRTEDQIGLVEEYSQVNGVWMDDEADIDYSLQLTLDLSQVKSSIAGPKRPQDKIFLEDTKESFIKSLTHEAGNHGFGLSQKEVDVTVPMNFQGEDIDLTHGSLFIAAITSCTNTSNPAVMMAAGLLARNAVEKGLEVPVYVKTSLAPGSKTVTDYYHDAGLLPYLDQLGFNVVGYGCTTCIGNSGPLHPELSEAIRENNLISASALSGNRNFEGRINPDTQANFLASPPLVIAFALAGRIDIDLTTEVIGQDKDGNDVFLSDIWPSDEEIEEYVSKYVTRQIYDDNYSTLYEDNKQWQELETNDDPVYQWEESSTYIQNPPYFDGMEIKTESIEPLTDLAVLCKFGDSVTTDHISPAGSIPISTPAGQYLKENGVHFMDFNSYGSRRGNHEVMMRGTLANIRIANQLADGKIGGFTKYWPTGEVMPIYDAAMKYKEDDQGLVILTGEDYGMGSSRDWAAKGSLLLNVKAVIAKSFERIHRANLIMMGILPMEFMDGEDAESLGLTGEEKIDIPISEDVGICDILEVTATHPETGKVTRFEALVRIDSSADIDYYKHAGILQYVIREKA